MVRRILGDMRSLRERDPACRSALEVLLCYPGFHAVQWHRLAHALYRRRRYLPARLISLAVRWFTGIEIHPGATIGDGVFIDHGVGVVVGETAEVGDGVTIYQGVTLGGTGKERGKRHPTIRRDVVIGAGAKILGDITIGEGCKIGAGAVVLRPVPPRSTVVGVPARIVARDGQRVPDGARGDADALSALRATVSRLESRVADLERARAGPARGDGAEAAPPRAGDEARGQTA